MYFVNLSTCLTTQDIENESSLPLEQVNIDTILELQREQQLEREAEAERKKKAMAERGIHIDTAIDDFWVVESLVHLTEIFIQKWKLHFSIPSYSKHLAGFWFFSYIFFINIFFCQ